MVRSLLAALALVLLACPAWAARPHASVSLHYAPGEHRAQCPPEAFLRMELASRFGYDPFDEPAPGRHFAVKITRRVAGYEVLGEIVDDPEARISFNYQTPPSQSCKQAVSMMSLAVAAELTTVPEPPVTRVVDAPDAAPPPSLQAAPPDGSISPRASPARPSVQIGAGSFLAINGTPSPTAGLMVSLGVRLPTQPAFSIAVEGHALVPRATDVTVEAGVPAEITTTLFSAAGVPCVHPGYFLGCAVVELGQHRVSVSDTLEATTEVSSFYMAAGARAGVELPLTESLRLRGYADLLAARLPKLVVHERSVWSPVPVTGALAIALTASF